MERKRTKKEECLKDRLTKRLRNCRIIKFLLIVFNKACVLMVDNAIWLEIQKNVLLSICNINDLMQCFCKMLLFFLIFYYIFIQIEKTEFDKIIIEDDFRMLVCILMIIVILECDLEQFFEMILELFLKDKKYTDFFELNHELNKKNNISEENPSTVSPSKVTVNGIIYNEYEFTAVVVKANKNKGKIIIPDMLEIDDRKCKVIMIDENAFQGKKITSVTVGKNVKSIGSGAFMNCKKLKTVTIKSKSVKFGKNCFKGIYAKATIKTTGKTQAKKVKSASVGYKKTMKVK